MSVLATFGELLQIRGEAQWPLAPLDAPPLNVTGDFPAASDAMTVG